MVGIIIILALILIALILLLSILYVRPASISIEDKSIDISTVLPIQMITQDTIVNGNGDITIGYRMFLPEAFVLSEEDVKYVHERLEGLFKMLPAGTVIHQQNFYYSSNYKNSGYSTNPLIAENLNSYEGKEIINCYSNLYITFTNSDLSKKVRHKAADTSLLRRLNYPFKQPYKDFEKKYAELESFLMNFENGLFSITQFDIRRMDSNDLNNAVYDYLNMSYEKPSGDATDDAVNKTLNPMVFNRQDDMKIGNQFVAVLSLTKEGEHLHTNVIPQTGKSKSFGTKIELPENIRSKSSMVYPLGLGLPFNHVVNVVIEVTDTDSTVTTVNAEKQTLNYITNFYPPAKEKQREQEAFINEIGQFDHQTAYTSFNVIVNDADKQMLQRKIALVQQGYSFMNQSSCYVENAELANLFFCGIPGNARSNYRGFINTTKQAICYLQKDSIYISSAKGHIFLDRFGTPVKIDMWDYPKLVNKNRIVIGPSGSGKSFWLNNYILQSYELGRDVMIIDIGGSYRSMIELNGGKYFDSTEQEKFAFNPFLCETDRLGRYQYLDNSDDESSNDIIDTIAAILSYIWKGNETINRTELAILKETIIDFYKYINKSDVGEGHQRIIPNMKEYRRFLQEHFIEDMTDLQRRKFDCEELILLLKPYTEGELSFLLNAEETVDIVHDKLIAFDMEDASKKDYFPLVALITLQMVIDKIKKRKGVAKELIIDEALDFLKDEKFGEFIAYLYRTFRKKEGSITLAAQNVLFLKNLPPSIKDSVLINCATKIVLDHSEHRSNLPEIQNVLSINESEISRIESLQTKPEWREFFIKLGNDSFVFRNEVSQFAAVAFDSRQATVVRIRQLFKETGSTATAIRLYLEEKEKKYG
jgi:conjugation system TraG family ATPase